MSDHAKSPSGLPRATPGARARFGWAWVPIPLLLLAILALWVADLRTSHESRAVLLLMNFAFTGLTSLGIAWLAGRSFLAGGQPGLVMLGCGALLWGFATLAASALVNSGAQVITTIHNVGVLGAAACHLAGLLWRGRVPRPGRWLAAGYTGVLVLGALLVWAARAGWIPVFFVEGQGGTPLRQVVLVAAMSMFSLASWLMLKLHRRQPSAFLYWYGLGLALLAVGLLGVMLQSVRGSALGWTGRVTQCLGGAYMLVAALASVRETGRWQISLEAAQWDDRLLRLLTPHQLWSWHWGSRYGLAGAIAGLATVLRWAMVPWIGTGAPYNVSLIAIVITTILLGIGPGLLCLLLADVAVEVFVVGSFATGPDGVTLVRLAFSLAIGAFVVCILHGTRVARRKSQKSEARLNALYASMTEGLASHEVVYADGHAVDYILTDVNPAFERITGIARARAVGARASALFDSGAPPYLDVYARVAESGQPDSFETDFAPLGKSFHISVFSPGQGRFATVFEDITARKQAEEKLAAVHRQTQSLIDNTTAMVYACDLEERFVLANAALAALLRTTPAQLFGKRRHEFMPQADADAHEAADRKVISAGRAVEFEEHSDLHGRSITWLSTKFPLCDSQGRIYAVAGIVTDISERKRTEVALRESEQRLRLALDAARAAAWETNLATGQNAWDERLARLLGVPAEEAAAAQQRWLEFVHPDDRARVAAAFATASEHGGPPFDVEFRVRRTDGTERWLLSMGMRVPAPDGTARMLGVVQDITERKQAEEALRQAKADLEQKVQERTAELAQQAAQLRALASELTLSEQRERRRMARLLHDHLQQLLVGAKLRATILGRAGDEAVREEAAEIEQLLDESILASRSMTAELSPPILHEAGFNAGLEWLARWAADKHGLFVDLAMEEDAEALAEDVKVLLFESVRELLFNCVKHSHTRSATMNQRRVDGQLQIVVADQGAGFDPAALRPAGSQGGGFGLFSIRERLGLFGGSLEIDSAPGKGSRFVLTAPVGPAPATEFRLAGTVPEPSGDGQATQVTSTVTGAKIRVLLADDHVVMREGLARLLGQEPDIAIIGQAADGEEAVRLAGTLLPDVILMDGSMPKLTGVEATRAISTEHRDIRIIGLSMFEEVERAQAMRDAGAVDYLAKSGPPDQLIDAIRQCMNGRAREACPAKKPRGRAKAQKAGRPKR